MANIPIYPGSSSFFPGQTPFGFYDYDYQFQTDADKVATYCARRLGYPLVDIELQDLNFYAAFEDAVTTYGNEVYAGDRKVLAATGHEIFGDEIEENWDWFTRGHNCTVPDL